MSDTPPPLPEKPPAFALPVSAWVAWAACAAICAILTARGQGQLTAYAQGELIGQAVALLLFPTLISWLVWRASSRSTRSAKVGFFCFLALTFFGQLATRVQDRTREREAVEKLAETARSAKAEMLAAAETDGNISAEQRSRLTEKTLAAAAEIASTSQGESREVALAMQAYLAQGKFCQDRQIAAAGAVGLDTFFDLDTLSTRELREAKSKAVRDLIEANKQLRGFFTGGADWLRQEMTKRGVRPATMRDALAGYTESFARNQATLMAFRDSDDALTEVLLAFIQFAETVEGRWSKESGSGKLILPTQKDVEQYDALLARVSEIDRLQTELQKKLFAPRHAKS